MNDSIYAMLSMMKKYLDGFSKFVKSSDIPLIAIEYLTAIEE